MANVEVARVGRRKKKWRRGERERGEGEEEEEGEGGRESAN